MPTCNNMPTWDVRIVFFTVLATINLHLAPVSKNDAKVHVGSLWHLFLRTVFERVVPTKRRQTYIKLNTSLELYENTGCYKWARNSVDVEGNPFWWSESHSL